MIDNVTIDDIKEFFVGTKFHVEYSDNAEEVDVFTESSNSYYLHDDTNGWYIDLMESEAINGCDILKILDEERGSYDKHTNKDIKSNFYEMYNIIKSGIRKKKIEKIIKDNE